MKTLFFLILFVAQAFGAAITDHKQQRFAELTAVLDQNFDSQTLDSLIPYQPASYQELTSLNLNSFDEPTWQTILRDIPASMSTGASNPAKLGKAIAHIKQYLESMTAPNIVTERKAAAEPDHHTQRFAELTVVLDQNFDSQTLESLRPYQQASYQELTSLNLNSFDEPIWQTILRDLPASMSTGASNPAKLGKAIAHIKQYLESITEPGIVTERKVAAELKRKEELVRQLEPKIQKLPFDQQEPSRIALRNLTVEQLYDKVRTMVMKKRSGR